MNPSREEGRPVRLRAGAVLRLRHADASVTYEVDCRMLFMGDRLPALERVYRDVASSFAGSPDPTELRRRLAASPGVDAFYAIDPGDGPVSLTLHDEIFREPGAIDDLPLIAEISCGDRRVTARLTPAELCALGALLPLLAGGRCDVAEIVRRVQDELPSIRAAWAIDLLEAIEEKDLLEAASPATSPFVGPVATPRVTLLGHSTLLVQSGRGALLVDPILRPDQGTLPQAMTAVNAPLEAILCSHGHWDHCDLQTLLWLDKRTPILIPRHRRSTAFNPPIAPVLARLGFRDVREVDHWAPVRVGDFEVVPIPFHGEQDEPDAEIDHYTYVIRCDGLTLYGGVDCYQDTLGDMLPVLERVRDTYAPSIAFLPISKMIYDYGTGGVNGFCRALDASRFERSFQYTASPEDAARWVTTLRPRWVCPYALFTFSRWSLSPEIADFAAALRRSGGFDRFVPLRPLDAIDRGDVTGTVRGRWRRRLRLLECSAAAAVTNLRIWVRRSIAYRGLRRGVRALSAALPHKA